MKHSSILTANLLCVGLFLGGCVTLPETASSSERAGFDYVTNIDGIGAAAIYDGVKLWIAENFRSAKQVIDLDDREQRIIVGNGVLSNIIYEGGMGVRLAQQAEFKMKVEVKEGKIRLSFSQYRIVGRMDDSITKSETMQIHSELARFGDQIAQFLKKKKEDAF